MVGESMNKTTMWVTLVLAVSACGGRPGGFSDALKYDAKSLTQVAMSDDTYRVFEHPNGDRLMVTSSIGRSARSGATFGAIPVSPLKSHEAAARQHLDQTGRQSCQIISGEELVKPQYEFVFSCPVGVTKSSPTQTATP